MVDFTNSPPNKNLIYLFIYLLLLLLLQRTLSYFKRGVIIIIIIQPSNKVELIWVPQPPLLVGVEGPTSDINITRFVVVNVK
jgi:hypothetical protein